MVSFQKSVADKEPYVKSFEETYKTAYSHGLESIYALENVDVKSIRTISVPEETPPEVSLKTFETPKSTPQGEFHFGFPFFCEAAPFFLDEPIQSLGLSRLAEKLLLSHQKLWVRDLVGDDLSHYAFLRGFGQGHIDEVRTKLADFIAGRDKIHAETIDFASWIRVLTAEGERKKWYFLLERHGLADLMPMSTLEMADLKKVTSSQRAEWERQAVRMINKEKLVETWKILSARFLFPWIRGRLGIVSRNEITERLVKTSSDPEKAGLVIRFMETVLFHGNSVLADQLVPLAGNYFALTPAINAEYQAIMNHALSYFYNSEAKFILKQLIFWLERDFARHWIGFQSGFIEKVIRTSQEFLVRKDEKGRILVFIS